MYALINLAFGLSSKVIAITAPSPRLVHFSLNRSETSSQQLTTPRSHSLTTPPPYPCPWQSYKWVIVHELAHQRGHGHDIEFNREFQQLAELVDPSEEVE